MSKAAVAGAGTCPGLGWSLFVEGQSRSGQPGQEHRAELSRDLWCPGSLATGSCPKAGAVCSAPGVPSDPILAPGVSAQAAAAVLGRPGWEAVPGLLFLVVCAAGGFLTPLVWILPAYRQGKGGLPAPTTLGPPGWKLSLSVNVKPWPIAGVSGRTGGPVSRGESGETVPQVEPQGQAVLGDTAR